MTIVDVRPTVEAPDDDPYPWPEATESPQALAWVEAQNSVTMKRFGRQIHGEAQETSLPRLENVSPQ